MPASYSIMTMQGLGWLESMFLFEKDKVTLKRVDDDSSGLIAEGEFVLGSSMT